MNWIIGITIYVIATMVCTVIAAAILYGLDQEKRVDSITDFINYIETDNFFFSFLVSLFWPVVLPLLIIALVLLFPCYYIFKGISYVIREVAKPRNNVKG